MTAKQRKILRESIMGYDPFDFSEDFANYAAVKDELPPNDIENNHGEEDKDRDEEERAIGESVSPKVKRETRKPFWLKEQGPISGLDTGVEVEPKGFAPRTNIEKGKYKIL